MIADLDLFYKNWSDAMNQVITFTTWGAVRAAGRARIGRGWRCSRCAERGLPVRHRFRPRCIGRARLTPATTHARYANRTSLERQMG